MQGANFLEFRKAEVQLLRIHFRGTSVSREDKNWGVVPSGAL